MSIRKAGIYAAVVCFALAGAVEAQARAGFGGSFGSRGARSFNFTPSTPTAPRVSPLGTPSPSVNSGLTRPSVGSRGFLGGGFGRGLIGGFLGAGLLGLLLGHGFFGGGLFSLVSLIVQIGLIFLLVRFAIGFFRNRQQSFAGAGPMPGAAASFRNGSGGPFGFGGSGRAGPAGAGAATTPLTLTPADYARFEAALVAVQTAFSAEDAGALRRLATQPMAEEFASELAENKSRGVINRMSDIRFIRGDLAEAWREPGADYASVALRYSLIDATLDRATGRVVAGDAHRSEEVAEVWTFTRPSGGGEWVLSAIQQAR